MLKIKPLTIILIILGFFYAFSVFAAGNSTGYAWGENIGWINFNPSQGPGVTVTDSAVTGYTWEENIGWLNLNPTYGGVINDGNGNLSGYAWGENVGWINFNPTGSQVIINGSTGDFSGYAWGENVGWISFSCATTNSCSTVDYKVSTDWRPQTTVTVTAAQLSDLSSLGYVTTQGETTNTPQVTYNLEVIVNISTSQGTAQVAVPSQTVVTKSGGGSFDFTKLTAEDSSGSVSGIANQNIITAIRYGVPNVSIGFDRSVTVSIAVGSKYNGTTLNVYKSSNPASDWSLLATCTISGGNCSFTITSTSYFAVSQAAAGGGMPPEWFSPPASPEGGFRILINDDAKYTNIPDVTLKLFGGPNTERMAISNFSDFRDAGQEAYTTSKTWDLCKGRTSCPEGEYVVYAKFYAPWGTASEVVSDTIILKTVEKPISEMTISELKAKIAEISEKITQLKAQSQQLLAKEVSEIPVNYKFTVDLKYGQRNDNVRYLQLFLKAQGPEIYPEGIVSGWFGPLTKKAVIRFQEKYAEDILASWELTGGTGFVGKTSRAKINEILGR